MLREARLVGDLTLGEAYPGDPDRGTKPWPWPFISVVHTVQWSTDIVNDGYNELMDIVKNFAETKTSILNLYRSSRIIKKKRTF